MNFSASFYYYCFIFLISKCVKCSESKLKTPILKGSEQESIETVLQSLYHLCPLRRAIFESDSQETGPLHLVFAKMFYDSEKGEKFTDPSIYINDYRLNAAELGPSNNPKDFYSWISKSLFLHQKYRNLLQWNLQTTKKSLETNTESLLEEQSEMLQVDPLKSSIQHFLNDFIESKTEEHSVVVEGVEILRSIQIQRDFLQIPEIASFSISRSPEIEFSVQDTITLTKKTEEHSLTLSVVILNEDDGKYSVCLKDISSGAWYKIKDKSMEIVDENSVLLSASRYGLMLFYVKKSRSSNPLCPQAKPSQRLVMDCLTRNTLHSISKTIQRQTSASAPSNSPTKSNNNGPQKSKKMIINHQNSYSSLTGDNSPLSSSSSAFKSNSILSLQSLLNSKTPPPSELAFLESILVPEDLSKVQMNMITTGSFNSHSESAEVFEGPHIINEHINSSSSHEKGSPSRMNNSFDLLEDIENRFSSSQDLELEYFEEHPRHRSTKGPSVWSTQNLSQLDHDHNYNHNRIYSYTKFYDADNDFSYTGIFEDHDANDVGWEIDEIPDVQQAISFDSQLKDSIEFNVNLEEEIVMQETIRNLRKSLHNETLKRIQKPQTSNSRVPNQHKKLAGHLNELFSRSMADLAEINNPDAISKSQSDDTSL